MKQVEYDNSIAFNKLKIQNIETDHFIDIANLTSLSSNKHTPIDGVVYDFNSYAVYKYSYELKVLKTKKIHYNNWNSIEFK